MRKLFYLGIVLSLLVSCNDEPSNPVFKTVENYLPLTVGNYWIYENYSVDTLGNETDLSIIDSVIITRDTVINNETYFVFEGTHYPHYINWDIISIVRDSSGCIINEKGVILFAVDNFNDILYSRIEIFNGDTIFRVDYQMEKPEISVTVPAGTYQILNYKGNFITPENINGLEYPSNLNNYYAKNVGKIFSNNFFLSGHEIFERRLLRYHIEVGEQ